MLEVKTHKLEVKYNLNTYHKFMHSIKFSISLEMRCVIYLILILINRPFLNKWLALILCSSRVRVGCDTQPRPINKNFKILKLKLIWVFINVNPYPVFSSCVSLDLGKTQPDLHP